MIKKICYYVALFLTVFIAGEGLLLFIMGPEILVHLGPLAYYFYANFESTDPFEIIRNFPLVEWDMAMFTEQNIAFKIHVTLGPVALVSGFFNLNPKLRATKPALHRFLGKVYLISQLVSLPAGIWMGFHEYGGLMAAYGFIGMGMTTMICSAMAYYHILKRDIQSHREWMIRSYWVMWSSVVLFRLGISLWIPFEVNRIGGTLPDDFKEPYIVLVFLSWSLPLLFADVYLSFTKPKQLTANQIKKKQ